MEIQNGTSVELGQSFLLAPEAERYLEEFKRFNLGEIGNKEWLEHHERLEKLNLQAHYCAKANLDNFVVEAMLTYDKVDVLVYNLLALEAWKEFVYPNLDEQILNNCSTRIYFIMYNEATLCNLLEVAMFHEHVVECSPDAMLELVDYCMRKITWLNTLSRKDIESMNKEGKSLIQELEHSTRKEELDRQNKEIAYRLGVLSVAIIRFMAEHVTCLSLNVLTRLLSTHDIILALVPLIENCPWTFRRPEDGKWKKFIDQKWVIVSPDDLLQITKTEAQVWIALYYFMCSPQCREKYTFHTFRKEQILRIRKYLNDIVLDQLPILSDVQRYMDELAIMQVPDATSGRMSSLIMEVVPVMRESIIRNQNWKDIANFQKQEIFSKINPNHDHDLQRFAELYNMDGIEELLGEPMPSTHLETEPVEVQLFFINQGEDFKNKDNKRKNEQVYYFSVDVEKRTSVPTEKGTYNRYVLTLKGNYNNPLPVSSHSIMKANIELSDGSSLEIYSENLNLPQQQVDYSENLHLPQTNMEEDEDVFQHLIRVDRTLHPKKLWRQAGCLDDRKGILQVQFLLLDQVPFPTSSSDASSSKTNSSLDIYAVHGAFLSFAAVP